MSARPPHAAPPELAAAELDANLDRGLTEDEARRRLERIGPNELAQRFSTPPQPNRGTFRRRASVLAGRYSE